MKFPLILIISFFVFPVFGQTESEYKKACEGGVMLGCTYLGFLEEEQKNKGLARAAYKKACEGGDKKGCEGLKVLNQKSKNH